VGAGGYWLQKCACCFAWQIAPHTLNNWSVLEAEYKSLNPVTLCAAWSYITVIAARGMRFWLTRSGNLNPLSISANDEPHGEWEACPQGCREQARAGLGGVDKIGGMFATAARTFFLNFIACSLTAALP